MVQLFYKVFFPDYFPHILHTLGAQLDGGTDLVRLQFLLQQLDDQRGVLLDKGRALLLQAGRKGTTHLSQELLYSGLGGWGGYNNLVKNREYAHTEQLPTSAEVYSFFVYKHILNLSLAISDKNICAD